MKNSGDPTVARLRNCVLFPIRAGSLEFKELEKSPIAFFCMEYALHDSLPIYAGGLGVLAGDFVLEAGRQGIPLVAIGGFFREGYETYSGRKAAHVHAAADPKISGFSLLRDNENNPVVIDVEVDDSVVYFQVWFRSYGSAHVFLIDTNLPQNSEEFRDVTKHLYSTVPDTKALQDLIVSIGGVKLLRCLGINPGVYHLNEGHVSFVALALAVEYIHDHPTGIGFLDALKEVRKEIFSTKHTIFSSAGIFFERADLERTIGAYLLRHGISFDDFFSVGASPERPEMFSTTLFMLRSALRSNGVSILHSAFEKKEHTGSDLIPITNGVYPPRWLDGHFQGKSLISIPDDELWSIHEAARMRLVRYVNRRTGSGLHPKTLTVTWARRFASYKRPGLLFSDVDRLMRLINNKEHPIQFIISGQAAGNDETGKALLDAILRYTKDRRFKHYITYLPDYSITDAQLLVAGSDIWLNTPERGKEACGTSSMKSGLNGGLQFSTSDGWIEEVDWAGRGWILSEENSAESLYGTFEKDILPLFYDRDRTGVPREWVRRMRATIGVIHENYTTRRMLADYLNKLYFPNAASPFQLYE